MHKARIAMVIGGALFAATSVAGAQRRDNIPPGQMPSPGMCRVWIDGVPAGRQPAQTDCATARRTAPGNARILYGSQIGNSVQTDPRRGQQGRGQVIEDPRRGADGRFDPRGRSPVSEQERERLKDQRKLERERQKDRDKEWKRSHRNGQGGDHDDGDDDGDNDDDDGDNNDHHGRGGDGRNGQDDERRDRRGGVGAGPVVVNPRAGGQIGCIDANRDGVCDVMRDPRRGTIRP